MHQQIYVFLLWLMLAFQIFLGILLIRLIIRLFLFTILQKQILPYVPSTLRVIKTIIASQIFKDKTKLVDLGSGDGTIVNHLAKAYPQAEVTGVEINRWLVQVSRFKIWLLFRGKRTSPTIFRQDMFTYPVNTMDGIVGFWISDFTNQLLPKFKAECKPGCIIASIMFPLPADPAFSCRKIMAGKTKVFIYEKL